MAHVLPGFVGSSVHVSLDGTRVLNYVQWQRRADLEAMLALPAAKAHIAEVGALADMVEPVPYRVAFVSTEGMRRTVAAVLGLSLGSGRRGGASDGRGGGINLAVPLRR